MTAAPAPLATTPIRAGHLIAIASGKGGVGKTWLSVTLAHALARAGRRILLVDADFGLANVDIQLGLMPRLDLATVLAGTTRAADAVLRHDAGFDVLPGRSGATSLASLTPAAVEHLLGAIRTLAAGYDIVLLDLGSGLDHAVRRLASAADSLVVVATEEPTSLTDAYAVLKLHARDRTPPCTARIVINQAASQPAGHRVFLALGQACTRYLGTAPTLLGIIRRDDKVRDAIRHQTPLLQRHPTSPAAVDAEAIAAALLG
jgi:flagellar biosynthesis protein FlhG